MMFNDISWSGEYFACHTIEDDTSTKSYNKRLIIHYAGLVYTRLISGASIKTFEDQLNYVNTYHVRNKIQEI